MGEVYRCGDTLLRDLAIKVLRSELQSNADAEERFLREARLTGSLQHPCVVPVHQLGRLADGRSPCRDRMRLAEFPRKPGSGLRASGGDEAAAISFAASLLELLIACELDWFASPAYMSV
jgi:serine/threonine protein kinase